jgi:hypothetical protein
MRHLILIALLIGASACGKSGLPGSATNSDSAVKTSAYNSWATDNAQYSEIVSMDWTAAATGSPFTGTWYFTGGRSCTGTVTLGGSPSNGQFTVTGTNCPRNGNAQTSLDGTGLYTLTSDGKLLLTKGAVSQVLQ